MPPDWLWTFLFFGLPIAFIFYLFACLMEKAAKSVRESKDHGRTERTKTAKQRLEIAQMKLAITPEDKKRRAECERLLAEYEKCVAAQNPKEIKAKRSERREWAAALREEHDENLATRELAERNARIAAMEEKINLRRWKG